MWKLKALAISKSDDNFDSSLDSEYSNSKTPKPILKDEKYFFPQNENKALNIKENLSEDKISIFNITDKSCKKIDWSLLFKKLFKNLSDTQKEKKFSLKEIDLRIDSTLNKLDLKKGFIKKKKNFDLSREGKFPKDDFISNIFENFSDNKNKKKKSPSKIFSKTGSKKNMSNKKFFSALITKNVNENHTAARTSYLNMIKEIDSKKQGGFIRNPKRLNTEKHDENMEIIQNNNQGKSPKIIKGNIADKIPHKKSMERINTIKSKNNIIKKYYSGLRENNELIQPNSSINFYDKEEILKNFQHDIRSYEKEAAKLKQVALERIHTREIIEFLHFEELREKINLSKNENKFYSKSLLAEYQSRVDLIVSKINNYSKMVEKNQINCFK